MSYQRSSDYGLFRVGLSSQPGSGIPYIPANVFNPTNAFLAWQNTDDVPQAAMPSGRPSRVIYPDYVKLIVTTPPQGTAMHAALTLDATLTRCSGGGVALPFPASSAPANTPAASKIIVGTPVIQPLSSSGYIVGREVIRAIQPAVNDEFVFVFGPHTKTVGTGISSSAQKLVNIFCQDTIPPGYTLCLHLWFPGASGSSSSMSSGGPAFEIEAGAWER